MEVVASLSQGRTAAAQCGLFTHKSVPVIFEPPCTHTIYLSFTRILSSYLFPFLSILSYYPMFPWAPLHSSRSIVYVRCLNNRSTSYSSRGMGWRSG